MPLLQIFHPPAQLLGAKTLVDEINRSSDRGAAIIAGSILEAKLTKYLQGAVHHKDKIWDNRTHSSGPLGSFAVKIDIMFMFGIISAEAHTDLICIKDIRNKFAHVPEIEGFDTQGIKDKCANLKHFEGHIRQLSGFTNSDWSGGKRLLIGGPTAEEDLKTPRGRFIWATALYFIAFADIPSPGKFVL